MEKINLEIGGDSKTVIAWANRGKNDKPAKLYVGDTIVAYGAVDPAALKPIQADKNYLFFALTLTEKGTIPPVPVSTPAASTEGKNRAEKKDEPAKTEEKPAEAPKTEPAPAAAAASKPAEKGKKAA